METKKNKLPQKGKVVVNITKKKTTTIDKNGQVIESKDLSDFDKVKEERAKKLGFK
jgi:hypothetical protein